MSVKAVLLDASGGVLQRQYKNHRGHPLPVALEILEALAGGDDCVLAITGSAGKLIAEIVGIRPLNEIVAQAYATRKLHPHVRTIIEMGGEDSKFILLDDDGMKDFSMNSVCAAGTGSFLEQQAERLRLDIEEFSDLSRGVLSMIPQKGLSGPDIVLAPALSQKKYEFVWRVEPD